MNQKQTQTNGNIVFFRMGKNTFFSYELTNLLKNFNLFKCQDFEHFNMEFYQRTDGFTLIDWLDCVPLKWIREIQLSNAPRDHTHSIAERLLIVRNVWPRKNIIHNHSLFYIFFSLVFISVDFYLRSIRGQ